MRLESLLHLVGGELQNRPFIHSFDGFCAEAHKVRRGDLFFAFVPNQIAQAIQQGAYGIIYEGETKIIDEEIAWIRSDDLHRSFLKLLRFFLVKNRATIVPLSPLGLSMSKLFFNELPFFVAIDSHKTLRYIDAIKTLFIETSLAQKLDLELLTPQKAPIEIVRPYLFEISFLFRGKYFERIRLSPLFSEELQQTLWLLDYFQHPFEPQRLSSFPHFKPIFLNRRFEAVEFGRSDRAIILEPSLQALIKERNFLESNAPWAKKLYLAPKKIEGFQYVRGFEEIREILYNFPFHYALIGQEFDIKLLAPQKNKGRLF